jgi:hypothetical protein
MPAEHKQAPPTCTRKSMQAAEHERERTTLLTMPAPAEEAGGGGRSRSAPNARPVRQFSAQRDAPSVEMAGMTETQECRRATRENKDGRIERREEGSRPRRKLPAPPPHVTSCAGTQPLLWKPPRLTDKHALRCCKSSESCHQAGASSMVMLKVSICVLHHYTASCPDGEARTPAARAALHRWQVLTQQAAPWDTNLVCHTRLEQS